MPLPAPAVVSADHIEIAAPIAEGSGSVSIELDAARAEAATFWLDMETGALVLTDGRWSRGDGELTFSRAELDLGDMSGVLVEARFTGAQFIAEGATLRVIDGDTLRGESLTVTICDCAVPTWDVTARRVQVELDDVARFTGGWIRVCERPVLPVPAGIVPLADRRSGLLLPGLAYNQDGVNASQPVFLTLGPSADLTLTPEWRQARGVRGLAEGRYALLPGQGGALSAAVGHDTSLDALRWAGSWRHGWQPGAVRTAVDARMQSDAAYLTDYGASFLTRATPFMESRALVAAGPVRLGTDLFQHDAPTQQQVTGLAAVGTVPVGPLAVTPRAQVDIFGTGTDPWSVTDLTPRVRSGARVDWGHQWSALRLGFRGTADGYLWAGEAPWGTATATLDARVPLWGDLGRWRHLADVGVVSMVGGVTDAAEIRAPDEALPVSWGVGPAATSRWVTAGGVPLSASLMAPWTDEGWLPLGLLRAQSGPWGGRLQLEPQLQHGEFSWSNAGNSLSAAVSRGEDILQVGGGAAARWKTVTVGWRHLHDLVDAEMLSTGPELRYVSPCDCLDVSARASWSVDRLAPDISIQVELQ